MNKRVIVSLLSAGTASLVLLGAGCSNTTPTTTTTTPTTNTTPTTVAPVETTTTAVTFNATASDAVVRQDVNGQWAATATASSQYGSDSWAAKQATGRPNVESYGDNGYAWAHLEKNKGLETLEVTFAEAVNAVGVRIRESYGSGAVTQVELKDVAGTYHVAWTGIDPTTGLNYLQVPVELTDYEVNGVRITVDTTLVPEEWAEIDAVQLVGE